MDYIKQINAFWTKCELELNLKPSSSIVYLALLQLNNRSGWKDRFRATYGEVMGMTGIANAKTYYSCLQELIEGDYIEYFKGPNQYISASFIIKVLYQNLEEQGKSTGKAFGTARLKHTEEQGESRGNIPKPLNKKPNKQETLKQISGKNTFSPPTHIEVCNYFSERINETSWSDHDCNFQSKKFIDFYTSKNWMVGKNKMAKWKSAASGWVNRTLENVKSQNAAHPQKGVQAALSMYEQLKSKP